MTRQAGRFQRSEVIVLGLAAAAWRTISIAIALAASADGRLPKRAQQIPRFLPRRISILALPQPKAFNNHPVQQLKWAQPKETMGEKVRYFFHVSGSSTYNDAIGQTFPNAEAAKAHAAKIANELGEDGSLNGHQIIVVNERGHEILRLPVA